MNDKVLIKLIVPEIDFDFDMFIPINEQIWKIKKLVVKSISDLIGIDEILDKDDPILINKTTSEIYKNNIVFKDTNIRNYTEIVLLFK